MKQLITIFISLFLFSCNSTFKKETSEANLDSTQKTEKSISSAFDFKSFKIMKEQLGGIKIGMTIAEAETHFSGLVKKVDEAVNFGFGGGSPAYLYYADNELIFGLISKLDTDSLLIIIAVHKKLRTVNGLNPNSTVSELLQKYPDLTVQQDLMNSGEFFQDTINNWDFVFMTDEKTAIGDYPELEVPSKPKRLYKKTDWIAIR
jgi:hypothetical protein